MVNKEPDDGFVSVADLLKADETDLTEIVDLPSGKGSVKIQPLTRAEVHTGKMLKQLERINAAELEAMWISSALVSPQMTDKEVTAWQNVRGSGGDLQAISLAVTRISGLDDGTPKSVVQNASGKPGTRKRNVHR